MNNFPAATSLSVPRPAVDSPADFPSFALLHRPLLPSWETDLSGFRHSPKITERVQRGEERQQRGQESVEQALQSISPACLKKRALRVGLLAVAAGRGWASQNCRSCLAGCPCGLLLLCSLL